MVNRRHLLLGLGAALAAPAVIRTPGLLMPVRRIDWYERQAVMWQKPDLTLTLHTNAGDIPMGPIEFVTGPDGLISSKPIPVPVVGEITGYTVFDASLSKPLWIHLNPAGRVPDSVRVRLAPFPVEHVTAIA